MPHATVNLELDACFQLGDARGFVWELTRPNAVLVMFVLMPPNTTVLNTLNTSTPSHELDALRPGSPA